MRTRLLKRAIHLAAGILLSAGTASAQGNCLNTIQYPFNSVVPNANGTVTTINTCTFPEEYSAVTGILNGATYEFTVTLNSYITVRSGNFNGPVVGQGAGVATVTTTSDADLFAHYTIDAACTQGSGCLENTVQILLDCTLPTVAYTIDLDCENLEFFVLVDVSDLGDAPSVDIENDGGAPSIADVGVGIYQVGPFPQLTGVQITVVHNGDALCSALSPVLVNTPCPVVGCGPTNYSYCFGNQENQLFFFSSGNEFPLAIQFFQGTLDLFGDVLTIYNGPDVTSPILFQGNNGGDLSELIAISSNPDNALTLELVTSFSNSCQDGVHAALEWEVLCLECIQAEATYSIVQDCDNFQFFVDIDVTSLGSSSTVQISNDAGVAPVAADAVGTYQVGPFVSGEPVVITLENDADEFCNISSEPLLNEICSQNIVCGAPAVDATYCYGPNDEQAWSYTAQGGGTLRLTFIRGTIESNTWDRMRIYDGADNTGDLLFEHDTFSTFNLGPQGSAVNNAINAYYGVDVFATGNALYMEMESDGSVQCDGSTTFDPWEWQVLCLDCTLPIVGASVEDDCANNAFNIPVTVATTGSGSTVNIVYTVNGGAPEVLEGVAVGQTVLGPFTINDVVNVVVEHETNFLCNVDLGELTDTGACPTIVVCGDELNVVYCEGNSENSFFFYQGSGAFPLALLFNSGVLEACCDRLYVYDGGDDTAPLLTPVGGIGGPLAGLFFSASNPENTLTVRITTDGSVSCGSGSNAPVDYTLSCLDCQPPVATFEIVQDCANFRYFVDVVVTELGTDEELELVYSAGADTLLISAVGTYQVGPFVSGTTNQFTLVNDANSLCNLASPTLVNPLCPQILCGASNIEEEYCYVANDQQAWAYELPGAGTLRLTFLRGTIESRTFDRIRIYDGPSNTSPLLFEHVNTATWNLGPVGSAVNNTIANFYGVDVTATGSNLYMEMESDGSVQCSNSTTYDPWEWIVFCEGCQIPGVSYTAVPDCFDRTYVMEVAVIEVSAEGLNVVNTFTGETQLASAPGTLTFGPFDQNDPVAFELTGLDNPTCSYYSDTLTFASVDCIIASCGVDNYEYCYGNNEDRWYTYQSPIAVPVTISMLAGQMLSGDRIIVYNGLNENAPVLYQGNNGGNFTGFAVNSQNVNNAITLRVQSNATGSCATGESTVPMRWDVGCGAVGIDELAQGGFQAYPNPTTGNLVLDLGSESLGTVVLKVFDMSGRVVMEEQFAAQGGLHNMDMGALMSGQYMLQLATNERVMTQRVQLMR